jgi:hypothetical protein
MRKKAVSSTALAYIFSERLKELGDCSPRISIAIAPSGDSWTVLTNGWHEFKRPLCAKRIEELQKQLRTKYVLKGN